MIHPDPAVASDTGDRLVVVHVASTSMEAYGLRAVLEAEDIPVFVKGESEGPYRMAYTTIYLYAPEAFEVQARLILAEALDGALSLPDEPD